VQPSARASDLISTAAIGAAASLLIAGLTFSHLLIPLLVAIAGVSALDLAMLMLIGLCRIVVRGTRRS
jgi:hypothetical protein